MPHYFFVGGPDIYFWLTIRIIDFTKFVVNQILFSKEDVKKNTLNKVLYLNFFQSFDLKSGETNLSGV